MSVDIVTVSNVAFPCRNFIPLRNDLSPPFARVRLSICLSGTLDYIPDAGTGLLSPISYALQRGILLRRENPTYWYLAPVAAFIHREPWEQLCRRYNRTTVQWYMRSTECPSSLIYVTYL